MRAITLLTFCLIAQLFWAQDGLDTIKYVSNQKYTQSLVDSILEGKVVIPDFEDLRRILESDARLLGWPYYYYGHASKSFNRGQWDSSIYYCNLAIEQYNNASIQRPKDEERLSGVYTVKGSALWEQKNYRSSLISQQKALDLAKKYEYYWIGYIYAGIAENHYRLGNDSLARFYFEKCLADTAYMSVPRAAVSTLASMGSLEKKLEPSKAYFLKAIKSSYEMGDSMDIHSAYFNIGNIYYEHGDLDSTIVYYDLGCEAYEHYGYGTYYAGPVTYQTKKAFLELQKGNTTMAIDSFLDAMVKIQQDSIHDEGDLFLYDFCADNLNRVFIQKNNLQSANSVLQSKIEFHKNYYDKQLKTELQAIETDYQVREKDASIAQLEQQSVQDEKIIQLQRVLTLSLLGLMLAVIGLGFYFWKQRNLKNKYEKENLEQRLLRSQMNPHFVFNALNSVSALVEKKSENTIPYIQRLATLFRYILTNTSEELISLEEELHTLKNYLDLQSNFSDKFEYELVIDESIDQENLLIPPMLIQPFIENSIHHGFQGTSGKNNIEVRILPAENENLLLCTVIDNGIGYTISKNLKKKTHTGHTSVSGDIVRYRLSLLRKKFKVKARFLINDLQPKGTEVHLFLPLIAD